MTTAAKKSGQTNKSLGEARAAKNDEFYTRRESIEDELQHYLPHLRGKTIYCNCDDPSISEFTRFFRRNFQFFGLRRLIATCYKNQNVDIFSPHRCSKAAYLEYNGKPRKYTLKGDGDFRSAECVALLRQADIVITNPPFSQFRDYVAQLIAENRKFIIIGNFNAVSYKDIFRFIMAGELWIGMSPRGMDFVKPDGETSSVNAAWFTNLPHKKRNDELTLGARYKGNESAYPKYDNYDAIEVSKVVNIPRDYAGVMGVPMTFLEKWNPQQFELIGLIAGNIRGLAGIPTSTGKDGPYIGGKLKYGRVLIRRK